MISQDSPIFDHMTNAPLTVSPDTTVGEARDQMAKAQVRHMPVVNGSTLLGIVTARDMLMLEELNIDSIYAAPVERLMTKELVTVGPQDPIGRVVATMVEKNIGAVLVREGQDLVGIFTDVDCARVLHELLQQL